MDSGVARRPIVDMDAYIARLKGRLDPVTGWLQATFDSVRQEPKRVIFAEGEDPAVIRAANTYFAQGFGTPILVGTKDMIRKRFAELGIPMRAEFEIIDTTLSAHADEFADFLYQRCSGADI